MAADPADGAAGFDLSEADRAELARPETMQVIREAAGSSGPERCLQLGRRRPHHVGRPGASISPPLSPRGSWSATGMRRVVPAAHGAWLAANVPGSVVKVDGTAGHLGEDPEEEIAKNARWLSAGIAP